jgi:hypothetical protein
MPGLTFQELDALIDRGPPKNGCPCPYCVRVVKELAFWETTLEEYSERRRRREWDERKRRR